MDEPFALRYTLAIYVYGLLLADLLTSPSIDAFWRLMKREVLLEHTHYAYSGLKALHRYAWQGHYVGFVERGLYITALIAGHPEFLAIWLTLKTVARSIRWTQDQQVRGRAVFNAFLVGNGLSLLFAIVSAAAFNWLLGPSWERDATSAVLAMAGLALAALLLWLSLLVVLASKDRQIRSTLPLSLIDEIKPHPS